jgi:hypothetical protein
VPDRAQPPHLAKLSIFCVGGHCIHDPTVPFTDAVVTKVVNAVMRDLPIEELSVDMIDELSALLGFKVQQSVLEAMHWTELEGILDRFYEVSLSKLPLPSQSNELLCILL